MLHELGSRLGLRVRPYTVTGGAPFASFVSTMSKTGVLVARHGPLLANAAFLPPGALVLELLPYNWEWHGISEIYVNLTRSMGDVHHFAWKAGSPEWALYAEKGDAKYADWTPEECSSRWAGGEGGGSSGAGAGAQPRGQAAALHCCLPPRPCRRHCLEAHARAGMIVDIKTVHHVLADLVPQARRGTSVAALQPRLPWPKHFKKTGSTGLWWEVA